MAHSTRGNLFLKQVTITLLNCMGGAGALLIALGILLATIDEEDTAVEYFAELVAIVLTLLGTTLVATSIYLPMHTRPADTHSKYLVAPMILALVAGIATWSLIRGTAPPHSVTSGLAILALAGSLFRLLPFSEWEEQERKAMADFEVPVSEIPATSQSSSTSPSSS